MQITNHQGLPEPLVRAVTYSDYDKEGCDYSVSQLLRPARQVALEQIHKDEITEDASDRLWLLLGSAGHSVLERSAHKGIVEERAIVEVEVPMGKCVSCRGYGKFAVRQETCSDCMGSGLDMHTFKVGGKLDYGTTDTTLFDYKFTSVWAAKEGPKDEWVQQLNIYRWLAHRYGVDFDKLQIVAIFRDWSKPKASREPDYPQSQVRVFDLPLWRDDSTEQFIIDRIRAHEAAKTTLPDCTPEEMWEKPEVWAIKKKPAKRAIVLCKSLELAEKSCPSGFTIEHRPAERPRCESYCRCAPFCEQWKQFNQKHTL